MLGQHGGRDREAALGQTTTIPPAHVRGELKSCPRELLLCAKRAVLPPQKTAAMLDGWRSGSREPQEINRQCCQAGSARGLARPSAGSYMRPMSGTVLDRVRAFIQRLSPEAVCDDCITARLKLNSPQESIERTTELAGTPRFERQIEQCALCGKRKHAIRHRP